MQPPEASPSSLKGAVIHSQQHDGVSYLVCRAVGGGAMATVFFALESSAHGDKAVALKILRPSFVEQLGPKAILTLQKEVGALVTVHREERVAAHVVRLLDHGLVQLARENGDGTTRETQLPWMALEFVAGGVEGTTLGERVRHCIRTTGYAFEPTRARRAIVCLMDAFEAVHAAGVVHRDVKPSNVLCRGSLEDEAFLLADFGVSRPLNVAATFGGLVVGTPGHAPPEQAGFGVRRVGPFSDVFGLATVVYYLLTGDSYFSAQSGDDALAGAQAAERRTLRDAPGLCPALRGASEACERIDAALATSTALRPEMRPQRARALGAVLLEALEEAR